MNLELQQKIDALIKGIPLSQLAKEREKLTQLYKGGGAPLTALQRLAYLSSRLPATYAAIQYVLKKLPSSSQSLLDVGSGPGTAVLALEEMEIGVERATLLERDSGFVALARQLTEGGRIQKEWRCTDVLHQELLPLHDLVLSSYCLNEIPPKQRSSLVKRLWQATQKFLVIIEPGTPAAFQCCKQIREELIAWGGYLIAPCPHSRPCPLLSPDWCHFGVRLERSSLQRKVKGAQLNYEDEKFFYLIFSKEEFPPSGARVLKRPSRQEGCVKIQVCSAQGIKDLVATQKNKPLYLQFKKLQWGDEIV